MSGGGSGGQPVAGRTKTKERSESEGTATPTLPSWLKSELKGNIGAYGDTLGQYGDAIGDWEAAGFSPDQLNAFALAREAAGGEYMHTPLDELLKTVQGDYLYGGEGFNAAVDAAYRAGMPNVLSQFGGAGRDDGGLAKVALAQAFADPFAAQYGQERSRQLQAAQLLPGMSLIPAQTLENIGKQYQQLEQYGQNYPLETLYPQLFQAQQGFTQMAQPFLGQKTTGEARGVTKGTSLPSYFPGNQAASGVGGILAGAGTGAQIGSLVPGIGTGIGAGIGGLLGGIAGFA